MVQKDIKELDITNFVIEDGYFVKLIPANEDGRYIQLKKSTQEYYAKIEDLRYKIIFMQIVLLMLFAFISYILAKNALKPLDRSIEMLDKFSKDLIHDLNTPVTSILLNLELLRSSKEVNEKVIKRLESSASQISTLHSNLTVLLQEKTFMVKKIDLLECVSEILLTYKILYPDITVENNLKKLEIVVNESAIKQILSNIISNAFKYNKKGGRVIISGSGNYLSIKDTGVGIKNVENIFQRHYKESQKGVGIGLDITKRLCDALRIELNVYSDDKGSEFTLKFH